MEPESAAMRQESRVKPGQDTRGSEAGAKLKVRNHKSDADQNRMEPCLDNSVHTAGLRRDNLELC